MLPAVVTLALAAAQLTVTPDVVEMRVGETEALSADAPAGATVVYFSQSPRTASVTTAGVVTAHRSGEATIVALIPTEPRDAELLQAGDPGVRFEIRVTVSPSPVAAIEIRGLPARLQVGDTVGVHFVATDANGEAKDVRGDASTSDPSIATVENFGPLFKGTFHAHPFYDRPRPDLYPGDVSAVVTANAPGRTTLAVEVDGIRATKDVDVVASSVSSLELRASATRARTGDVIHFSVVPDDAPVRWALETRPDPSRAESVGAGAPAHVLPDGRFVAEQPGLYTVIAVSGAVLAKQTVLIDPRDVTRPIEFVGQAPVRDRITSDFWVWEGLDGRDYAALGTWNADGHALFFDVTDPADMQRIAEVQVDARTVNDVKVSDDARVAVITREGASNRKNGFVMLDVSNPRDPQILSRFDDQLTGGVHNVFLYENHVYAINNGRRWDVINVEDPKNPFRVSRFEGREPGRSVHDVWVRDGIAFQAGNTDGIVLVDVGGGGKGGSPASPVEIGRLPQLTGWNHAVWPFRSPSTGKFYVIAGDESHPVNPRHPGPIIAWEERATSRAMGWIHVLEFDDTDDPKEVARYRVPEAGPHNLWIDWENEILYVAYFNGGLRVVDISGELIGDLYRQGREIAKFYSDDPQGYVPNSPFVWGPQPHKGVIFFSDFHSGLWAVRLLPRESAVETLQ